MNYDIANYALKACCPENEILVDSYGLGGIYVVRAKETVNNLMNTTLTNVHPAFVVNGVEKDSIYFSKFNDSKKGNAVYSMPGMDPIVSVNADTFIQYCRNKGTGYHCLTAAELGYLALRVKKAGTIPLGNNDYGKDVSESARIAIPVPGVLDSGQTARVLEGTGPLAWSDTHDIKGIFGLNGNIWKWICDFRLVHGEVQVIPYNNAAQNSIDLSASSSAWRALNASATSYDNLFITPNGNGTTSGSVKLDYVSGHWQYATSITSSSDGSRYGTFGATTASGLSDFALYYLRAIGMMPDAGSVEADYNDDGFWGNNGAAERLLLFGGRWSLGAQAGVWSRSLADPRSAVAWRLGGRSAFVKL